MYFEPCLSKSSGGSGTPYLIKEKVNSATLMENVATKSKSGKLPVECQKAVLDLVAETNGKGYFLGDVNPGNVYFQKLPDGTIKAKFLEVDFSKKINFAKDPHIKTPEQLVELQKTQMLESGRISEGKVLRSTTGNGGSAGTLKNLLDEELVDNYSESALTQIKTKMAEQEFQSVSNSLSSATKNLEPLKTAGDDAATLQTTQTSRLPADTPGTSSAFNLADEMGKVSDDFQKLDMDTNTMQTLEPASMLDGFDLKFDLPTLE